MLRSTFLAQNEAERVTPYMTPMRLNGEGENDELTDPHRQLTFDDDGMKIKFLFYSNQSSA